MNYYKFDGLYFQVLLIKQKRPNLVEGFINFVQLCSVTLLSALCILLRSATKITHKAQAITGLAAKWHVCATLDSFDGVVTEGETPMAPQSSHETLFPNVGTDGESETDEAGDEEDEIDTTKLIPSYAYSTISYQKRQALGNYFNSFLTHPLYFLNYIHV